MSLSIHWHAAKDNYCILPTVQIMLKVHSLMTLMKAITVGTTGISELPTNHNGRHTEKGNTEKQKGSHCQQLKHSRLGWAWLAGQNKCWLPPWCDQTWELLPNTPQHCLVSDREVSAAVYLLDGYHCFSVSHVKNRSKLPLPWQTYWSNCHFIRHPSDSHWCNIKTSWIYSFPYAARKEQQKQKVPTRSFNLLLCLLTFP